RLLTQAAYSHR
ncbi:hypothetical protein EC82524_4619B, partial [Escherichia coli 8.2524]